MLKKFFTVYCVIMLEFIFNEKKKQPISDLSSLMRFIPNIHLMDGKMSRNAKIMLLHVQKVQYVPTAFKTLQ